MAKAKLQTAEDTQPALGLISVRRPEAVVTKLPVLIQGQHRLVVVTEYHDGTVTLSLDGGL